MVCNHSSDYHKNYLTMYFSNGYAFHSINIELSLEVFLNKLWGTKFVVLIERLIPHSLHSVADK